MPLPSASYLPESPQLQALPSHHESYHPDHHSHSQNAASSSSSSANVYEHHHHRPVPVEHIDPNHEPAGAMGIPVQNHQNPPPNYKITNITNTTNTICGSATFRAEEYRRNGLFDCFDDPGNGDPPSVFNSPFIN